MEGKSIKKKLLKVLLNLFLVLVTLPFALTFLFREPLIQTISARIATHILTKSLGYSIRLDVLYLDVFSGIKLKGLSVKDHRQNVLLKVDNLTARPVIADWQVVGPVFRKIEIDGAEFVYGRYKDEEDYNLTLLLDKISGSDTSTTSSSGGSFKMQVKSLKLENSRFHFFDENSAYESGRQMNYSDFIFDSINLDAKKFILVDDSINMLIEELSVVEKSGFKVDKLSADFIISRSGLHAHNLLVEAEHSNLDMDLDFNYRSYQSMGYFIDSVQMYGLFRPTIFDMSDVGYFSDVMFQMKNTLGISGEVKGTVSDLDGKDLRIHFGEETRFAGDVSIKGLPDFFTSYMVADIREFSTTNCDLLNFQLPVDSLQLDFSTYIPCDAVIRVKGDFNGYYSDFVTDLDISTDFGKMKSEIAYSEKGSDSLSIDAMVQLTDLEIGKILKLPDLLNSVTANFSLDAKGKSIQDMALKLTTFAQYIDFMNYRYSNINLKADYKNNIVNGIFSTDDENLKMEGKASVLIDEKPEIDVVANINKFYLSKLLNWEERDLNFSTHADIQIQGIDLATMAGTVELDTSRVDLGVNEYAFKNIFLSKSYNAEQVQEIVLKTDYADLSLQGNYDVTTLADRFIELINHYFEIAPGLENKAYPKGEYAEMFLSIKDDRMITEEFVPGLDISHNATISGSFDFDQYKLGINTNLEEVIYNGIVFKENDFSIKTKENIAFLDVLSQRIILKDSSNKDKTVFGIDRLNISCQSANDSLGFGIYWNNLDTIRKNSAIIEGLVTTDEKMKTWVFNKTILIINDTLWTIQPENKIIIDSSGVTFNHIVIDGGKSSLSVTGKIPRFDGDSIGINFHNFNISNLDIITDLYDINADGIINGSVEYSLVGQNPTFISDLKIDGLAINNEELGYARLMNTWDNSNNSIYINSQIFREGNSGKGEVAAIRGFYYPFSEENTIDLSITFNRFKLVSLAPILSEYVTEIEGQASGDLKLVGNFKKPSLTGTVDFYRASMRVNYLNTKYSFSNNIVFEPDKINLDNIIIYDTLGNKATLAGSYYHNYFTESHFDFTLNTDRLLFFNTTKKMNDLYYGSAITSGKIHVSGDPHDIKLQMDVRTAEGTNVFLPLDYSVETSDKDYIVFVEHIDYVQTREDSIRLDRKRKIEEENKLDYALNLNMDITKDAFLTIYLPSDMGKIESKGFGDLKMNVKSDGEFGMIGEYIVEKGMFNFALGNLVSKKFELVNGGKISWTGDPYLANVRIKGLYKVKTSINNLGIAVDSSTNYKSKVTVECYVVLSNMLLNPDISFEIKIPDLDPDLQRAVFANLDTTNIAMMNEQMISLLMLGSFSFSNASNISLSSSYYTVLTNQLSSMLSKLSDDVDIGVNYKPGDAVSQNEFDVALSTQFLDDRLIVEGNFGMTYDRQQQSASNLVGDVDISYNLTKDGRWILKGYNHSNVNSWYNYSNYDKYAPYTQGVGVAYRKDFNRLAELFQRTRPKKKDVAKEETNTIENNE